MTGRHFHAEAAVLSRSRIPDIAATEAPFGSVVIRQAMDQDLVARAREDAFAYWVYVHDVDVVVKDLAAAGATIVAEPADQPWGERVAQARDPEGNLVYLAMSI